MSRRERSARIRFADLLNEGMYEHALLTTYGFDPLFFEEEVLERYRTIRRCGNLAVLMDYFENQKLLELPASLRPKLANLRYLLQPVRAGRRFHPKVLLFAAPDGGLLITGSANLTQPGLCANAELIGVWRYEPDREAHLPLFRDAFLFFKQLEKRVGSPALTSAVHAMEVGTPWLRDETGAPPGLARFIHNLDRPIVEQIAEEIRDCERVVALSPFLDPRPDLLNRVLARMSPKEVTVLTGHGDSGLSSLWTRHASVSAKRTKLFRASYGDGERSQNLHAKALAVKSTRHWSLLYGSANFTEAGLARNGENGNIEAGVWVTGLPMSYPMDRLLDPLESARPVDPREEFNTREIDTPEWEGAPEVELREVEWDEPKLTCSVVVPERLLGVRMRAVLRFHDEQTVLVPVNLDGPTRLIGQLVGGTACGIDESSTRAHLEAFAKSAWRSVSATVLVVNIQDSSAGRPIRRARMIREAELGYPWFAEHFRVLTDGGDVDALLEFLTNCRIQARDLLAGERGPLRRDPWSGDPTPWLPRRRHDLDDRTVYDAACEFIEWHLRALDRHISRGTPDGIPNFVHIALAICEVAADQACTLVAGIEARQKPLAAEEWREIRSRVDRLVPYFSAVLEKLLDKYVPALAEAQPHSTTWQEIVPSLPSLLSVVRPVLGIRDRIDARRRGSLRVQTVSRTLVEPPYFESDLLSERRWREFKDRMGRLIDRLDSEQNAKSEA